MCGLIHEYCYHKRMEKTLRDEKGKEEGVFGQILE